MHFFILFLLFISSQLNASVNCQFNINPLSNFDSVHKHGIFRVYYAMNPNNINYIYDQTDINNNNIPDYVENILIQADAIINFLTELGFTHPLESYRYKGSVEFIDIHVLSIDRNGIAFEVPKLYHKAALKENKCALIVSINNNLKNFNNKKRTIIAHEIFHLYQYGYNQFKNPWYLEGMTFLINDVFESGSLYFDDFKLPSSLVQMENKAYSKPYKDFWSRLSRLSPSDNPKSVISEDLLNIKYIDGDKVFRSGLTSNFIFIKKVLEKMKIKSEEYSEINNWNKSNWSESDQRSDMNNTLILKSIQEAMVELGMDKSEEEINFLKINY